MQIPFRRVGAEPHSFELSEGGVSMAGILRKYGPGLVLLEATISGKLEVDCFRCGESFDIMPKEEVAFLISEGLFRGQDETYDVVEMYHDTIDLEAVFTSEIALIENDYHACDHCR